MQPPRTYKMKRGRSGEGAALTLERRRTLSSYQLPEGERQRGVRLYSKRWNLSGTLDLLIETEGELFPVDLKMTTGPPRENHRWQLAAYALLLREERKKPVRAGFIRTLPLDKAFRVELPGELVDRVEMELEMMRTMLRREAFPEPTPVRGRCSECEYRNFCGDIY